jgi:ATP synthase protein I
MSDPAPDPEKLRALGRRLDDVHRRDAAAKVQPPPSPMGFVLRLATELVLALFVGAAIGWGLDWLFGQILFQTRPVFMVIMILFGAAAGIRNVFRVARKLNAENAATVAAAPAVKDEGDD